MAPEHLSTSHDDPTGRRGRGADGADGADLTAVRRVLVFGYLFGSFVFLVTIGFTFDRIFIACWVALALALGCIGRPRSEAMALLRSWAPFIAGVLTYVVAGGVADALGRPVQVDPLLNAERRLFGWAFGGELPTAWVRSRYFDETLHWYDAAIALVYLSHYIVPYAVAAYLWKRHRDLWRRYALQLFAVSFIAAVCFAAAPTAPPWMAAEKGMLPDIERLPLRGLSLLGLRRIGIFVVTGQTTENEVAAFPSLHNAHALMVAVALWPIVKRW